MIGLLIKDMYILKNQQRSIILIFVIGAFMYLVNKDPYAIIALLTIIFSMFSVNTISYDEMDNGFPFLFTLPVSRKEYVYSKYIFGAFCSIAAWGISIAFTAILIDSSVLEPEIIVFLLMGILLLSIEIPIQLKFGIERSRVATSIILMAIAAICVGVAKLADMLGITISEITLPENNLMIVIPCIVICILMYIISCAISISIIKKK